MPRTCSICQHTQRTEIEAALVAGTSLRDITRQFKAGKDAVARHRDGCISESLSKATDAKETLNGESLLARLKAINSETLTILKEARKDKDGELALKAIARVEKQIELEGKLLGELDDAPTVNINVAVGRLQAVIIQALASFPEAKVAVSQALMEAQL